MMAPYGDVDITGRANWVGSARAQITAVPTQIPGLTSIVAICAGWSHSLFLKSDGTVWACGYNHNGQIGDSTTTDAHAPVQVKGISGIVAIGAGNSHSLFVKSDGTVWGCGENIAGQLGSHSAADKIFPVNIQGLAGIIAAQGGEKHSLFLKNDGTAWSCGENIWGQLGNYGNNLGRDSVAIIPGLPYISAIAAGGNHSLFLTSSGAVWACGYNSYGQVGNGNSGSFADVHSPVLLTGLANVKEISGGDTHSLFLKHDGTVWGCGNNYDGRLGLGKPQSFPQFSTPTKITGLCQGSLSVQELSSQDQAIVFPNPFSSQTTITIENKQFYGTLNLKTDDIAGREVKQQSFDGNSCIVTKDRLKNGLYFYHITSGDKLIASGKLLITE